MPRKSGKKAPETKAAETPAVAEAAAETASKKNPYDNRVWINSIKDDNIKESDTHEKWTKGDKTTKEPPYGFANNIPMKMPGTENTQYVNVLINRGGQLDKEHSNSPERTNIQIGKKGNSIAVKFDNGKDLCTKDADGNYQLKDSVKDKINEPKFKEQVYTSKSGEEKTSVSVQGLMKAEHIAEGHKEAVKEFKSKSAERAKEVPAVENKDVEDQIDLGG